MEDAFARADGVVSSRSSGPWLEQDRVWPVGLRVFQQRRQVAAVHLPWEVETGESEERRNQIDASDWGGTDASLGMRPGIEIISGERMLESGGNLDTAEAVLAPRQALVRRETTSVFSRWPVASRVSSEPFHTFVDPKHSWWYCLTHDVMVRLFHIGTPFGPFSH
jgi:hypothetical protein